MIRLGTAESFIKVVQEKVDNPLEFSKVLKSASQSRGNDVLKFNVSHLYVVYAVLFKFPVYYFTFFFTLFFFPLEHLMISFLLL